jgi:hypothetical protein
MFRMRPSVGGSGAWTLASGCARPDATPSPKRKMPNYALLYGVGFSLPVVVVSSVR